MAPIGNAVFATLLMNDGYLPGAMVLGHSLKDRGAKGKLVVFILADKLASSTITELKTIYDEVVPVQQIINRTPANLYLMDRPDLISTFTKIELWRQTQYKRIVYIDADAVALRAPNELLTMDTEFAAVPDIGWPDCFNSGLLVLNPNMADYYALLALAERGISFDGADQGLLNMHFTDWERLSFAYNCTPSGNYQYVPAYRHFQSSISLVHFIGREKPWNAGRSNSSSGGVYGELLGRWWAVYDRHYRAQQIVYYTGSWQDAPKKLQDYVAGEETIYLPGYQAPRSEGSSQHTGYPHQGPPPPSIMIHSPSAREGQTVASMEQPLGDQPHVEEQIRNDDFKPTPTVQQRKWSAPHVEWEPSRAPPPTNSKPEASNFPSTIYEMSGSKDLFRPPANYPDAPKDMWYQVPEKVAPPARPKPIFPWEAHAPKPTRVFAEPKLPSPPPESTLTPVDLHTPAETESSSHDADTTPSATTDITADTSESAETPKEPYVDPWTTFNQRSNAWDEMPEITRYMQALTGTKKGKIEVLHHTPSASTAVAGSSSPSASRGRRPSLIITDFPTANDRPSLPVTPAPIKRSTVWGDDREEESDLPAAEGVPKQEEWVRRFSSYPQPQFNVLSPLVHEVNGVLCFNCQQCGHQNPIAKLEELQRRQSLLSSEMASASTPPQRDMPESSSKDAVVEAAEKAMTPPTKSPLKPILKQPSFELSPEERTAYAMDTTSGNDGAGAATRVSEYDLSPQATQQNTLVNTGHTSYISDDALAHVLEDNLSPMTTIESGPDAATTSRTERKHLISGDTESSSSNTATLLSNFQSGDLQTSDLPASDVQKSGMQTSDIQTGDRQTSDIQTSDRQTGDLQTSDIQTSGIQTGDLQTGDIQTSDIQTRDHETSDVQTSDIQTSDIQTSDIQTSDIQTSDIQTSDIQTSDMQTRDHETSDLQTSDIQTSDVQTSDAQTNDLQPNIFQSSSFQPSSFQPSNFQSSNLRSGDLQSSSFQSGDFQSSSFKLDSSNSKSNDFQSGDLQPSNIQSSNFQSSSFQPSDFQSSSFQLSNFSPSNFQSSNFQSGDRQLSNLQFSNFSPSDLQSSDFQSSDFQSGDRQSSNFQSSNFQSSGFQFSDFQSSDFQSSNFQSNGSQSQSYWTNQGEPEK